MDVHTGTDLDSAAAAALEAAFRRWADSPKRPADRLSRARVLALFLILRHSGAKLAEGLAFDAGRDLDPDHCLARFEGRTVALPERVMRELASLTREIGQSGESDGFGLDQGYVRRVFAKRGGEAGLSRELSNPSALRRFRALELALLGAPDAVARRLLGLKSPPGQAGPVGEEAEAAAAHYARRELSGATSARNSFFGKVTAIEAGSIQSLISLSTISGERIQAMITNESATRLGLAPGGFVTALVKAPWVTVQRGMATTSADNALRATVARVEHGDLASEIVLELAGKTVLCALAGRGAASALALSPGEPVTALFSAHAVILSTQ